jgi:hypothetical protein
MSRTPDQIRRTFALLRETCDPLGHDLLAELEHACLVDNALLKTNEWVAQVQADLILGGPLADVVPLHPGHSVKVGA